MSKKRNVYWLIAGGINFFTAILHTLGGQMSLVNPLIESNISAQAKAEWFGAWHMVTIILFFTSYLVIKNGLQNVQNRQTELIKYIGYLYIALAFPFIVSSILHSLLAPQWILLLPIGFLIYCGTKKQTI